MSQSVESKEKFLMVRNPVQGDRKAVQPTTTTLTVRRGGSRPGKAKGKKGKKKRTGKIPDLPPSIEATFALPFRIRTLVTSQATGTLFTRASLAMSMGGIVTVANTTVRGIVGSFRIQRIIAWPAASGDVTLSWNTSGGAEMALVKDSVKVNDLPNGVTQTGGMIYAPPKGSVVGMWQTPTVNGTDQLLQISATSGSIVDFEFVGTLSNQYVGAQATIVSGTLATFVYLYPDGTTTHVFQPRGLPTTF